MGQARLIFGCLLARFEPEVLQVLRNSRINLCLAPSYERSVDAGEPHRNRRAYRNDRPFERDVHGDLHQHAGRRLLGPERLMTLRLAVVVLSCCFESNTWGRAFISFVDRANASPARNTS
jgi:hypothetical protein